MSLHPTRIGEIPSKTMRVARAAFARGTVITRLRDEFAHRYEDEDFRALYPSRGQPGLAPWRLGSGHGVFSSSNSLVTGKPLTPCVRVSTGSTRPGWN